MPVIIVHSTACGAQVLMVIAVFQLMVSPDFPLPPRVARAAQLAHNSLPSWRPEPSEGFNC